MSGIVTTGVQMGWLVCARIAFAVALLVFALPWASFSGVSVPGYFLLGGLTAVDQQRAEMVWFALEEHEQAVRIVDVFGSSALLLLSVAMTVAGAVFGLMSKKAAHAVLASALAALASAFLGVTAFVLIGRGEPHLQYGYFLELLALSAAVGASGVGALLGPATTSLTEVPQR